MVTFELKSGERSDFRPDASGKVIIPIKGKFLFPTKWLNYQVNLGNIGVDDHDLFVKEVSKSKMLLIYILIHLNLFEQYDFVIMSSTPGDYEVFGYDIPQDRGVYPMIDSKQGFPVLEKLRVAVNGQQLGAAYNSTPYSYNKAMESYFINYGLVLRNGDPTNDKFGTLTTDFPSLLEGVKDWLKADELRSEEAKREALLAKRREKVENIPAFILNHDAGRIKRPS